MKRLALPLGSRGIKAFHCERRQVIKVKAKILTPSIVHFLQVSVFEVLGGLLKLVVQFLIVDAFLRIFEVWTIFAYLPYSRLEVYGVTLGLFALGWFERNTLLITRILFSKSVRVVLRKGTIKIRCGLKVRKFPRHQSLALAVKPIEQTRTGYEEVFEFSREVRTVINDQFSIPMFEVFDPNCANDLVSAVNALIGLDLTSALGNRDIDPSRAGLEGA